MGTASDLRLVGWNGTMWMDLSGAANASGTSAGSTLSGTIPPDENITQIGIGSIMNPLPISLVDFNVKKGDQETALLYWTAVMDLMSDRFEIERNVDGKNWEKLGTIIAKDGNQRLANYNFTDSDTKKGLNLYRLKMIDKNATFTYSLIRSLEFGNTRKDKVILYPNPATQIITLDVDDISSIERIQIRDVNGRILLDQQKRPVRNLPKSFNLKHFASGTYIATITGTDGAVISVKVVKR